MALDDSNLDFGSGGGGEPRNHHDPVDMKTAANMMQRTFDRIAEASGLCPNCSTLFVLGRMAGHLLWQNAYDHETGADTEPDHAAIEKLLARVGTVALLEWQRLIDTDGAVDGPNYQID